MNKQINKHWQTIWLATIAMVFSLGGFSSTFGQTGVGAKYSSRDPQICAQKKAAGARPSVSEAITAVICNSEGEFGGALYLVEDVKVTTFGKGQRPNPNNRLYPSTPDLNSLEYEIRGSFKKYQCNKTYGATETQRNCNLYDHANAKGVCYKDTFGGWVCTLSDQSVTDGTPVVPPSGKKATNNPPTKDNPTTTKNGNPTTDKQADTDENRFLKPDFSELEKYFEIIRYEYEPSLGVGQLNVLVKMKKKSTVCNEWFINFYDADGVKLRDETNFIGKSGCSPAFGEPVWIYAHTPSEKLMKEAKKISIIRKAG